MNKYTILPIAWALFIAVLCGIPGRDIPHISFLELLSFDKWVHAFLFFMLTILFLRAQNKSKPLTFFNKIIITLICISYGIVLEILQDIVFIERSADVYDVIANSTGTIVGIFSFTPLSKSKILHRFLQ